MQLSMASSHSMLLVLVVYRARARAQAPSAGACLGRAWSSTKLKSANIFVRASFGQSNFSSCMVVTLVAGDNGYEQYTLASQAT